MKKSKAISFLLSLSLLASMVVPGTLAVPAYAAEDPTKGMEISKTAKANDDGTYTITLEAYATGEKISSEVTKDVPTDIVLVLDQSGSMAEEDFPSVGTTTYTPYTDTKNSELYKKRHNDGNKGNLYYPLSDGSYATVSVTRTQGESTPNYTQCQTDWQNDKSPSWDDWYPDDYWKYSKNLYVKVGNGYEKVRLDRKWVREGTLQGHYKYTYTFPDDSTFVSEGDDTSPGNFNGKGPLYYLSGTTPGEYTYTYTCTDAGGNTINIGTSTGENTNFTSAALYYQTVTDGGNIKRLQALKNAVTGFTNSVATKAAGKDGKLGTDDDVDHRIAVVGFAARKNTNPGNYTNTELFIGENQYKYGDAAQGQYTKAFQNMKTEAGQKNVTKSIDALDAYGGTHIDLGMEMAKGILDKNPVPNREKRNRVVIVFTDGSPGSGSWTNDDMTYAENAINYANELRDSSVNVYTVGIFNGADATSKGNQTGNDTQKANWFMQNLSDNKGTPQTPSYYLSAADSNTLNNIFKQIADNIESGGSSTTLDANAVIRDIIAPQFQLPAGATANNITLETYKYTGENQWEKNTNAMGATATVNGDQVNVTGFDFSENWCGTETANGTTTYRGNKLVISFPVVVKEGFLGGNGVYTNSKAGVYENASSINPVLEFNRPQVDVKIEDVTVTAPEKNVYLMGDLTADQIKDGVTVDCGGVAIDLSKDNENYDLETWQNAYVDIAVTYTDKKGNTLTDLNDLTDDTTYTVSVNVSPINPGTVTGQAGKGEGKINVFKPELTYKDSEVYYGDTAPDCTGNLTQTKWKHGETLSDAEGVTMIGTAPTLDLTYTPEAGKIADGKINTKEDISVDVSVKIGTDDVTTYTTFQHTDCEGRICTVPTGKEFLLHVKTCTLTIAKQGGADGEPYVFDICKDGEKYSEVTIVGDGSENIEELPVGEYTIEEDTGWSWRYSPKYGDSAALTAQNPTGSITCTNEKNKNQWLNGFSDVVKNISGVNNNN